MTALRQTQRELVDFQAALEHGDAHRLAGCYAEDARVSVVTRGSARRPAQHLSGRQAVEGWGNGFLSEHVANRVVTVLGGHSEITLIAECRRDDKSMVVLACTTQLVGGLIAEQYVVVG